MSVVLYDSANKVMISDTRAYSGGSHPIGNKQKIHRLLDGSLLGMCSSQPGVPEEFKAWLDRGGRLDDFGPPDIDLEAILVTQTGEVYLYYDSYYRAGPLTGDVFTIGSGKEYALGAWHATQDGVKAVEAAIECNTMCGGPVAVVSLHVAE